MNRKALRQAIRRAEDLCRERGVRFTDQRRRVLEIICAANRPMGAYEILESMKEPVPGAAPPTVYRALNFLLEQGLIHKLETLHAFVGCTHPEHPHASQFLICTECGDISEMNDMEVARRLQRAGEATGFKAQRRVVEVIGTCGDCAVAEIQR